MLEVMPNFDAGRKPLVASSDVVCQPMLPTAHVAVACAGDTNPCWLPWGAMTTMTMVMSTLLNKGFHRHICVQNPWRSVTHRKGRQPAKTVVKAVALPKVSVASQARFLTQVQKYDNLA
mmetsp:Transcript_88970/g.171190  ORF Transcript_88970/g.171190 Transcript_88970/m.171190 type:complete len:119 (+) Transcript_88970:113-469(+)